jgi:hypothetical protein
MTPNIEISTFGSEPMTGRSPRRRRLAAIAVIVGIAAAGGLIGSLTHPADSAHLAPGPYTYFPI